MLYICVRLISVQLEAPVISIEIISFLTTTIIDKKTIGEYQ